MRTRMFSTFVVFCLFALGCGAGAGEVVPMPPDLVGTWTTEDARYEDRFLELTPTMLVIGTGQGQAASYPIASLRLTQDDRGRDVHVLDYLDAGTVHSMGFYFSAADADGTLRMRNQPTIVWRKAEG